MTQIFTAPDAWVGGLYELCIELPERGEKIIRRALATLWQVPILTGCYLIRDVEPEAQTQISPSDIPHEGHVYGVAQSPSGKSCACGTYISDFGSDGLWAVLYLPFGSLTNVYFLGGYPFGDTDPRIESSLRAVNAWLKEIAEVIYQDFRFPFGVIGFETNFEELRREALTAVPKTRSAGLLIGGETGLEWYPPNYES
jgi:hypothetical protein